MLSNLKYMVIFSHVSDYSKYMRSNLLILMLGLKMYCGMIFASGLMLVGNDCLAAGGKATISSGIFFLPSDSRLTVLSSDELNDLY